MKLVRCDFFFLVFAPMIELLSVNGFSPSPKLQGKPGAGDKPALPGSAAELGCWMSQQPARGTNLSVCSSEVIVVNSLRFSRFWGLSHASWHPDWADWLLFSSFFFYDSVEEKHRLHNSPFPQWPLLFSKASNKPKRNGKFVCTYLCVCVFVHLYVLEKHTSNLRDKCTTSTA